MRVQEDGKWYYIPKTSYRICGDISAPKEYLKRYRKVIDPLWQPPAYMFYGKKGGHLSLKHVRNGFFAVLDLDSYYELRTDTKIYRALRKIGVPHSVAYKLTGQATVSSTNGYVLARGLNQSNLLASLVFDMSLLGSKIRGYDGGCQITVYGDDIIISGWDEISVSKAYNLIREAAISSNFAINEEKTQDVAEAIEVFNIILSSDILLFTDDRIERFYASMREFKSWCDARGKDYWTFYVDFHGDYIYSVYKPQLYEVIGRLFREEVRLEAENDVA